MIGVKSRKTREPELPPGYTRIYATKAETMAIYRSIRETPRCARLELRPTPRALKKMSWPVQEQVIWRWARQRVLWMDGLYWFCVNIMGFYRLIPSPHEDLLCRTLQTALGRPVRHFFEWHRSSYKTTVVSIGWPCWIMGTHPEQEIMLVQATMDKAKKTLSAIIRAIGNNRKLKTLWPDLRPALDPFSKKPMKWATDGLLTASALEAAEGESFSRDFTLGIGAVDGSSAGDHPTVLIIDDIEDERNTRYPADIERTKDTFEQLVGPVLQTDCPAIMIGTPWAVNDLHHEVREGRRGDWEYLRIPLYVYDDDGNKVYAIPKKDVIDQLKALGKPIVGTCGFDEKVEAQLRQDMTPFQFDAQYLCSPSASKHQKFDPDTWTTYSTAAETAPWRKAGDDPEDAQAKVVNQQRILVVSDIAQETGREHDYTTVQVWGIDSQGHAWLYDMIYDKYPPHKIRESIFDLCFVPDGPRDWEYWNPRPVELGSQLSLDATGIAEMKLWRPTAIIGEDYTYGKAMVAEIGQECIRRGVHLPIRKVTVEKGPRKADRILKALEPLFRARRIHVPERLMKYSFFERREVDVIHQFYGEFVHFLVPGAHDDAMDALHLMRPFFAKHFRPVVQDGPRPTGPPPKRDYSMGLDWMPADKMPIHAPHFEPEPYAVLRRRRNRGRVGLRDQTVKEALWRR